MANAEEQLFNSVNEIISNSNPTIRIIVEVKDGLVTAVYSSSKNVVVDVLDYDNILAAEAEEDKEEHEGCKILEEEVKELNRVW